jgi:DNA-binding sugar fermentation-stimulating protein
MHPPNAAVVTWESWRRSGRKAIGQRWSFVQRDDVVCFSPYDEADPAFGRALREAAQTGVKVYAYRCRVSEREVTLNAPLPVADLAA